jgi:NADPH:quinone reductase-like Zn-dependent oxidoreductase
MRSGKALFRVVLLVEKRITNHQQNERNEMNGKFSGKVVLVTGGTSGIGKTTAIEFARASAKVALTGRHEKGPAR